MAHHIDKDALRFLVVDPDRDTCRWLQELLWNDGFHARTVSDPTEVDSAITASDAHVLVVDLAFGGNAGIDVVKRARAVDGDVAIVVTAERPSFESAQTAIRHGVDAYLTKPLDDQDLRRRLAEIIAKKGLDRTPEDRIHRALGLAVRDRRLAKSLTLKDLARRTGLSVSLLSQIERAESSASIASLHKIAKALNARIADLFREG